MRKLILAIVLIILSGLWLPALEVPASKGYVSDYAGLLTSAEAQTLDQKLRAYDQQTTNQVVVLIVKSLGGESIESFGIKVAGKWKPGQKGKDNGVIFIVAKEDRATRIEVGYGLEWVLTDAECALILNKIVTPRFKNGNYYEGVNEAIEAIFKSVSENFSANVSIAAGNNTKGNQSKNEENSVALLIVILMVLIPFIIIWKTHPSVRGKHSGWWSGGGARSTGGGFSGGGFRGGGGGGFSGGGGGFGGGGASGRW
ncbi:MAG TPA: TPM domain-containing protein [Planctomycetota bacterium]|nr:TPM domain-containing protein [Planctomycetota bacterium]